jgi:hypothetical protein
VENGTILLVPCDDLVLDVVGVYEVKEIADEG